jgi:hypothetical protein
MDRRGSGSGGPDYNAEARKLFARLNLEDHADPSRSAYNDADCVFKHPTSGGCFFIGNQSIAASKPQLSAKKIRCIVNCQEATAPNFHEKDTHFEYLRFPISYWKATPQTRTPDGLFQYMRVLFSWIDQRLDRGENVMVHCLAGAHRAGTAGTAYVMYKAGLDFAPALESVRACRPFVDPIYDFKELLQRLEKVLRDNHGKAPLATGTAGKAPPAAATAAPNRTAAPAGRYGRPAGMPAYAGR